MKKKTDYIKILKEAFFMIWRNKILLLFGLIISIANINGLYTNNQENSELGAGVETLTSENTAILYTFMILGLATIIILVILKALSEAVIIKFAGGVLYKKKPGFKELFNIGKKYALKLVLVDIILFVGILILLLTLSVPIAFLFSMQIYPLAYIIGLLAVVMMLPILVIVYYIREFAYVFVVVSELSVKDSIEKGYETFKNNIISSIVFSLVLILVAIALLAFLVTLILPIAIFIGIPGIIAYLTISKIAGFTFLIAGIVIFVLALIVVQSFYNTLGLVAWVLFVKELIGVKSLDEDRKKELEVAIVSQASEV